MTRPVEDFIPELVAFSVDFYGSLFISVCMSNSSSFYLTAMFIAVDVVHLLATFREISSQEKIILEKLQDRRETEQLAGTQSDGLSRVASRVADSGDLITMIIDVVRNPKTHGRSLDGYVYQPHLISGELYTRLKKLEASGTFGPRSTNPRTVFSDESRSWLAS